MPPASPTATPDTPKGVKDAVVRPWIRLARTSRWPRWPRWAVLMVLGWLAFGYLADSLAKRTGTPGPTCVFKRITSHPCPTCGSGRGSLALLHGDAGTALSFNPLYFTLLGLAGMVLALRLLFARKIEVSLPPWKRRLAWGVFLMLVAANWAYLIINGI